MFDHVKIGASDYAASKAFFLQALQPLGIKAGAEGAPSYGIELCNGGEVSFCLCQAVDKPAPLHVAFAAASRAQVDAFHRAALQAGGRDHGAPGLRPQYSAHYYAAFVIGPDGHNIEAVCHAPDAPPALAAGAGSEEGAVRALHLAWIAAVNAGDLQQLLGLMTDDVVFINPGREPVGRGEFPAGFTAAHRQHQLHCSSQIEDLLVLGAMATTCCRDRLVLAPRDGSPGVTLAGHRLTVYRQLADGHWRLARDAHTLAPVIDAG